MEHEQAEELLSDYFDGVLAPEQAAELERHLRDCPECDRTLRMLRQALSAVSRIPRAKAPPQFARRVARRARKAGLLDRRRRARGHWAGPLQSNWTTYGLLLAVGLLLVVVILAQQQIVLLTTPGPARLELRSQAELSTAADCAWNTGAEVRSADRTLDRAAR